MKSRFDSHLFWGSYSPLSLLSAAALIILASSRLDFAIICTGALAWVYGLTALAFSGARKILPVYGKKLILLFLSAFVCGVFMILMGLLNPLLILGTGFFLILIPPCLLGSGLPEAFLQVDFDEVFSRAILEALVLWFIIIAFALIREPLGMGTLSFPGGAQGIVEIFGKADDDGFVLVRILSASAGGLLLLGYGTALFRYLRDRNHGAPNENHGEEEQ